MNANFQDRSDAGKRLAARLTRYAGREDVVVLGLPRGGVPVAYEVANALGALLDVFLVRKLGVPAHEELAMGAIASGGVRVLNKDVVKALNISPDIIEIVTGSETAELARRERAYRGDRPAPSVKDRVVFLIDDGLATGATMRAGIAALKLQDPKKIVVAVPIAAPETCDAFRDEADEVVCAGTPRPFYGVGQWYVDFSQTTDEEVRELLRRSQETAKERAAGK